MSRTHIYPSPKHWNNNILCSVDIQTTGPDPEKHDIIEIAILPLDDQYKIIPQIGMFNTYIKPFHNLKDIDRSYTRLNDGELARIIYYSIESGTCKDLLEKWSLGLGLPERKKIIPLSHCWQKVSLFLIHWLGPLNFNFFFSEQYRDLVSVAAYHNDKIGLRITDFDFPFPHIDLSNLCSILGVTKPMSGKAVSDVYTIAECYARILRCY